MASRFNTLENLKKYVISLGYKDIKVADARSFFILVTGKRETIFNDIIKQLGGKKNSARQFGGSLGHIDVDSFRVGVKPLAAQGSGSAGVDNESFLVKNINSIVKKNGKCDVLFIDGKNKFLCKNVTDSKQVGADTANRKKSDVNIIGDNTYPVSIKKDNAEMWESADSFWRDNAVKYLTKLIKDKKVSITSIGGGAIALDKGIGIEGTLEETVNVVFGSDILRKGCVITKTFIAADFKFSGKENLLTVNVSSVISKVSDIPDKKQVWFLIRNDSTRKSIPNYPGTRVLAVYKSRINTNVVQIPLSQRK